MLNGLALESNMAKPSWCFGSDDDVFHAGGFSESDDIVCAEAGGVELWREGLVLGDGNGGVVHDPPPTPGMRWPFQVPAGME